MHAHPLRLVVAALLAAAWLALGAGPAAANIVDPDAVPDFQIVVASPGSDYAGEVLVVGGIVYVAGSVPGASSPVASLLRLPLGSTSYARPTATFPGRSFDIARGPSGSVYTSGYRVRADSSLGPFVARWAKSGGVLWRRFYDPATPGSGAATDVAADTAGNVVMCAEVPGRYLADWAVVSWSPSGKRRWVWRYSGSGRALDSPQEIFVDKNGNAYVTGNTILSGGVSAACTVKLSPAGKALWVKTYTGPDGAGVWASAIAQRTAGGVYVGGNTLRADGSRDALVLRYSPTGRRVVLPPYSIGGATVSLGVDDLTIATDGTIAAAGSYYTGTDSNQLLCTWNADESLRSHMTWGTPFADHLRQVAADQFGGLCATGTYANGGDGDTRVTTRRTVFDHGAVWERIWDGPSVATHSASGIACWRNWVVTAGTCESAGTGDDQFIQVWKY